MCRFLSDGNFVVRAAGKEGQAFVLQASQDRVTWTSLQTNSLFSALLDYADRASTNFSFRFYRGIPQN
jgi:hypothetical protein